MDLTIHKKMWPDYILDMLDDKISNFCSGHLNVQVQMNQWVPNLVKQSAPILLYKFPPESEESLDMKKFLLEKWKINTTVECSECEAPKELKNFNFLLQFMPKDSYIPWHEDMKHFFVLTTYLNKEWEFDWGGAFLYIDGKSDNRFLYPEYNTAVRYGRELSADKYISHSVTKIAELPPNYYRTVLQTFWS